MARSKCTRCYRAVPILFSEKHTVDNTDYEIKLCDVCTARALNSCVGHTEGKDYELFVKSHGREINNPSQSKQRVCSVSS